VCSSDLVDTRVLGSSEWLAARMRDFAAIIHSTPRADATVAVRLPGDIELDNLERNRRDGVALDPALVAQLEAMAAGQYW